MNKKIKVKLKYLNIKISKCNIILYEIESF